MSDEVTVSVLREIREELRTTRIDLTQEIRATREELSARIDATREGLSSRIDATNEQLGHVEAALVDLAEQQRFVVRWLSASTDRDRKLEQEVGELKARVDAIEERLPEKG